MAKKTKDQSANELAIITASAAQTDDDWSEAYAQINQANAIIASAGGSTIATAYANTAKMLGYNPFCDPRGVGSFYHGWPEYVKAHAIDGGRIDAKDGTKTRFFQAAYMGSLAPEMEKEMDKVLPPLRATHKLDGSNKGLHKHRVRQDVLKDFLDKVPAGTKRPTALKHLKIIVGETAESLAVKQAEKQADTAKHVVGIAAKKLAGSLHNLFTKTPQGSAILLEDEQQQKIADACEILLGIAVKDDQIEEEDARKKRVPMNSDGEVKSGVVKKVSWDFADQLDDDDDEPEKVEKPKQSKPKQSKPKQSKPKVDNNDGIVVEDDTIVNPPAKQDLSLDDFLEYEAEQQKRPTLTLAQFRRFKAYQ